MRPFGVFLGGRRGGGWPERVAKTLSQMHRGLGGGLGGYGNWPGQRRQGLWKYIDAEVPHSKFEHSPPARIVVSVLSESFIDPEFSDPPCASRWRAGLE
jgi:hypothetical protein